MGSTVSCSRLHFSSHYHLLFLVYILPYDISILSMGLKLKIPIHQPIHQSTSSSPCLIRFFYFPFGESIKKRLMPTCIRFCSFLPCHFCTWISISSLLLFSQSISLPPTSIYGQSFAQCLLFSCFGLPRFHAVPCLVFIHLHLDTNRQCLHPSYGIGLSFSLLFSVRSFISPPPIVNSFPNALQIFLNIYHKNCKNIVHLLLRFICTRSLLNLFTSPYTFIHCVLISPPFL